jgi:hypothetical protein
MARHVSTGTRVCTIGVVMLKVRVNNCVVFRDEEGFCWAYRNEANSTHVTVDFIGDANSSTAGLAFGDQCRVRIAHAGTEMSSAQITKRVRAFAGFALHRMKPRSAVPTLLSPSASLTERLFHV